MWPAGYFPSFSTRLFIKASTGLSGVFTRNRSELGSCCLHARGDKNFSVSWRRDWASAPQIDLIVPPDGSRSWQRGNGQDCSCMDLARRTPRGQMCALSRVIASWHVWKGYKTLCIYISLSLLCLVSYFFPPLQLNNLQWQLDCGDFLYGILLIRLAKLQ